MPNHHYLSSTPILTLSAIGRASEAYIDSCAVGHRVAYHRERIGVSRRRLARLAGIPETTLRRVEHGERRLLDEEAGRVALVLGVSALAITTGEPGGRRRRMFS